MGEHLDEIDHRIATNPGTKEVPRSQIFLAYRDDIPGIPFFVKLMPKNHVHGEWIRSRALPDSVCLHRPCDRSSINASDHHFVVSRFIDGIDLWDLNQEYVRIRQTIPRYILMKPFWQTAYALYLLHRAKRVHCDVKPENLMRDFHRNRVRLIDFEYCTLAGEVQPHGTDGYFPPETLKGRTAQPPRDIYSFGIAFLFLWAGERPKIVDGQVIMAQSQLESAFGRLLRRMVDPCPARRPTAEEILMECFPALNETGNDLVNVHL
jgi:serine/threonine protein kinase